MSEWERILIFGLVGVTNSLVDLGTFWILLKSFGNLKIWGKTKLKNVTVFHICGFVVANINSFLLNSIFTFADTEKDNPSWASFFSVSIFSAFISTIFVQYFSQDNFHKLATNFVKKTLKKPLFKDKNHWYLFIKLVAIGITMILNYIGYKLFVF